MELIWIPQSHTETMLTLFLIFLGHHSLDIISPWSHKQINCKGTTCHQMWPFAIPDFTPMTTFLTSICVCKILCEYTVLN